MEERICYHCFSPLEKTGEPCPHCGYDARESEGKYPLALPEGSILNGRYIVGRTLGQGGFGITYVAQEVQSGQRVAIKEFFPETMATRTERHSVMAFSGQRQENFTYGMQCFLSEAQTLAQFIGVENIVRVHSYFEENGTAYFVMDYVDGVSFQTYLKQRGGKISWKEAKKILFPVMDALSIVHSKGIIHRDIAPDNIYITRDGTVKLLDFGAARYSLGDKSRSLDVVLKAGYAPKEQYTRRGRQGPYTDVYSLAATFYYAITGRVPPESVDRTDIDEDELVLPSSYGVHIPEEAEDALEKALAVRAADRWQTMAEFRRALSKEEEKYSPVVQPAKAERIAENPVPVQQPVPKAERGEKSKPAAAAPAMKAASKPERQKKKFPVKAIALGAALALAVGLLFAAGGSRKEPTGLPIRMDKTIAVGSPSAIGIREDGSVAVVGLDKEEKKNVSRWEKIVQVDTTHSHTVGLQANGRVVAAGSNEFGQCDISTWSDIVEISTNYNHTVGLKSDGTVVAAGPIGLGQCHVSDWQDIVSVSAGFLRTVGLRSDGTVVTTGAEYEGAAEIAQWTDIVAISADGGHVVGLKADGTVVAAGENRHGQCDVSDWTDIVAISAGYDHTVGLRSDGTCVAVGQNHLGQCDISDWTDIAAVSACGDDTMGLRSDGTVIVTDYIAFQDFSGWTDIRVPDGVLVNTTPLPLNSEECVLRSDIVASDDKNPKVLGSDYLRKDIVSITFLDTIHDAPEDSWDVSESGNGSVLAWVEPYGARYDLKIAGDGGVKAPADCSDLFRGYERVSVIDFNDSFHVTSDVTNMAHMFQNCVRLKELDVRGFDTSNVTDMNHVFFSCESLAELDVSGFDTTRVTDMDSMFAYCQSLTKLDVRGFDTSHVTNMGFLFSSCQSLTELDVSGFDTSNVTNMGSMFSVCSALPKLDVGGFDTAKVTDMGYLFSGCKALTNLDVSSFDTSNVTDMGRMFNDCQSLTKLDVSEFNTSKVMEMDGMFCACSSLKSLNLSNFNTSNVTNMSRMFYGCTAKLNLGDWETGKVCNYGYFMEGGRKYNRKPWENLFK